MIARFQNTTVFIEVKTRWGKSYGLPEESITPFKLRALIKTAHYYMMLHQNLPQSLRVDVVAVEMDGSGVATAIRHFENVTG